MINFRKLLTLFIGINLIGFLWWLILIFNTFPKKYYSDSINKDENYNSAIVVLTGGKGRINKGIELFDNNFAKFLIISGVFRESESEIKDIIDKKLLKQTCCVVFDKNATNTQENAIEVAKWLDDNRSIKKLILVSSYYHLPRSYMIFSNVMDNIDIKLVPVEFRIRLDKSIFFHIRIITLEYFKIIYTSLRLL